MSTDKPNTTGPDSAQEFSNARADVRCLGRRRGYLGTHGDLRSIRSGSDQNHNEGRLEYEETARKCPIREGQRCRRAMPAENVGEVIRAVNHVISEGSIHKGTDDERDPDNHSENRANLLTIH